MKVKRFLLYLMVAGMVSVFVITGAIAQEESSSASQETAPAQEQGQAPSGSFITFENYPDHTFNVREYIQGMQKGGDNLLIWKDPSVNLSQYNVVKVTDFGGRLLPQQNVFSYYPFIAVFNSTFRSSLEPSQADAPNGLLIEGAVVECNPGSRALRCWIGFGAGKAACAVVCEVYEPGKANPCIRIYTRDTASLGITSGTGAGTGGDSVLMLDKIMTVLAQRLAMTLNITIPVGPAPAPRRGMQRPTPPPPQAEEGAGQGEGQ